MLNLNLVSFQYQFKALGLTAQKCQRWICGSSGFSWLSVGKAVLTLVSVTLGHSDDIDHLVLGEHLADGHLLLKVLTGKVDLVGNGASVKLNLHDVSLLLPAAEELHLGVDNDPDGGAVLLHLMRKVS